MPLHVIIFLALEEYRMKVGAASSSSPFNPPFKSTAKPTASAMNTPRPTEFKSSTPRSNKTEKKDFFAHKNFMGHVIDYKPRPSPIFKHPAKMYSYNPTPIDLSLNCTAVNKTPEKEPAVYTPYPKVIENDFLDLTTRTPEENISGKDSTASPLQQNISAQSSRVFETSIQSQSANHISPLTLEKGK